MTDRRRGNLLTRISAGVDRAWARFADSRIVELVTEHSRTPQLDLTMCLERMDSTEPSELVTALQWLQTLRSPQTARASARVVELTEHDDAQVAQCACETLAAMRAKFGEDWAS